MYLFLGIFCLLTIIYADNKMYASLHAVLCIACVYVVSYLNEQKKPSNQLIIGLVLNMLLPIAFAKLVGNKSLLWLFEIIIIFQSIFLVPVGKLQWVTIAAAILSATTASFLQNFPLEVIISRALILTSVSSFSLNAVNNLLRSQEALRLEAVDNKLLNIELQNTRNFQRQVLDSTNYAIIAFDLHGNITEFNKGAENMLGYKTADVLNKIRPIQFYLKSELEKRTDELNKKYSANINPGIETLIFKNKIGLPNTNEWTFVTANGTQIRVQVTYNNLKDKSGRIAGFIAVATDITSKKLAEEKQQTAETIISNSSNVLLKWMPDERWTLKYVSANVLNVLGYSSIELTNGSLSYATLINPDDLPTILTETQNAINQGNESLHFEYRMRHKNNQYIWVEELTFIKRNDYNEIEYFEGIISDISTRKVAEIKLKESEIRHELVAQGIEAGIWDWLDTSKDEEWWSPKFFELLGYENNEIKPSMSSFASLLHPDDEAKTYENLEKHFAHKIPYKVEYRLKTKSGAYKWFLASGQSSRDANGKPTRMVGSIIEIDQNKKSEDLLKLSEERFRMLIESASDIFYQTDANGLFIYLNEAAQNITGYQPNELLGKHYSKLIPPQHIKSVTEFYSTQIKNNNTLTYHEFPIQHKNGQLIWIGQNVKLQYQNGHYTGVHVVARDITIVKQAQEHLNSYAQNLERINKELENFAHVVSHDLKAPVKSITQLQMLIKDEFKPHLTAHNKSYFEMAEASIVKITNFIEKLLEYSRVSKRTFPSTHINLVDFINENIVQHPIPSNVIVKVNAPQLYVLTDTVYLTKILNELIDNAITHNRNLKTLIINVSGADNKLLIEIGDDGTGMNEEVYERLFQPFKTVRKGDSYTGLGLVIVKKIIDTKKETIALTSQPTGTKVEFTWTIEG